MANNYLKDGYLHDLQTYTLECVDSIVDQSEQVPLLKAEKMYQWVDGTSDHSVYFYCGGSDKTKIACRILKNGQCSVRVEGELTEQDAEMLKHMGFECKGKHHSVHCTIQTSVEVNRLVLGTFITLRMMTNPIFDASVIQGHGK